MLCSNRDKPAAAPGRVWWMLKSERVFYGAFFRKRNDSPSKIRLISGDCLSRPAPPPRVSRFFTKRNEGPGNIFLFQSLKTGVTKDFRRRRAGRLDLDSAYR
jgi:hypothetical protein